MQYTDYNNIVYHGIVNIIVGEEIAKYAIGYDGDKVSAFKGDEVLEGNKATVKTLTVYFASGPEKVLSNELVYAKSESNETKLFSSSMSNGEFGGKMYCYEKDDIIRKFQDIRAAHNLMCLAEQGVPVEEEEKKRACELLLKNKL